MKPAGFSSKNVYPATLTGRLRQAGCRSLHRDCDIPGIMRRSSRKPPLRRLRSCGAAGLHTKGYMRCRCASRLTDMAYSPGYQIFGRERRQCKVVRRDALHAPTPRSALPRLKSPIMEFYSENFLVGWKRFCNFVALKFHCRHRGVGRSGLKGNPVRIRDSTCCCEFHQRFRTMSLPLAG